MADHRSVPYRDSLLLPKRQGETARLTAFVFLHLSWERQHICDAFTVESTRAETKRLTAVRLFQCRGHFGVVIGARDNLARILFHISISTVLDAQP